LFGPGVAEATMAKAKKGSSDTSMPQAASYRLTAKGRGIARRGKSPSARSAWAALRGPARLLRNETIRIPCRGDPTKLGVRSIRIRVKIAGYHHRPGDGLQAITSLGSREMSDGGNLR
jgi:hypothetical protein